MLWIAGIQLISSFSLVFIGCELAGLITYQVDVPNDEINQFNWYLFPLKIQQILPMFMANAQKTVGLQCFGSANCDRDTFKKV